MTRRSTIGFTTAVALLAAAPLAAQGLRLGLDPNAAAIYRRAVSLELRRSPGEGPAAERWRPAFADRLPPPLVLGAAVDDARTTPWIAGAGIGALGARLALDLATAPDDSRVTERVAADAGFGPADRTFRWSPMDADGAQRGRGRLGSVRGAGDGARIRGRVEIDRKIDRRAGRVAEFTLRLDLDLESLPPPAPASVAALAWREDWRWQQDVTPGSAGFFDRVAAAHGAAAEKLRIDLAGSLAADHGTATPELALGVVALSGAGSGRGEPAALGAALRTLRTGPLHLEDLGPAALALVASARGGPSERLEIASGALAGPRPVAVDAASRVRLAEATDVLVAELLAAGAEDPARLFDTTATTLAARLDLVRALEAARLAGIAVPVELWRRIADHGFATARAPASATVHLQIMPTRAVDRSGPARPRSFGSPLETAIALDNLVRTRDSLIDAGPAEAGTVARLDELLRDGLAALQVGGVPSPAFAGWLGPVGTDLAAFTLGLDALGGALERLHVGRLGDRDWYFVGALLLTGLQRSDGGFGDLATTARALAFLRAAGV